MRGRHERGADRRRMAAEPGHRRAGPDERRPGRHRRPARGEPTSGCSPGPRWPARTCTSTSSSGSRCSRARSGSRSRGPSGSPARATRPVEVPVGVVHDWWNAGATIAHVRVEVEADPAAEGRPAARFVSMIEAAWSLGALGHVNAKGMPSPLWLAAVAREYSDVIRFVRPPAFVQAALFGPLAAHRAPHRPRSAGPGAARPRRPRARSRRLRPRGRWRRPAAPRSSARGRPRPGSGGRPRSPRPRPPGSRRPGGGRRPRGRTRRLRPR